MQNLESSPATSPPPRVLLLTSPGLFGAMTINRLAAATGMQLVGVGLTDRIYRNKGKLAGAHTFRLRTGWRYFTWQALQADVSWTTLQLTGRPKGLKQSGASVRRLTDVNSTAAREWMTSLRPDYVASLFFNQKIGPAVCAIPPGGCINLHPSLLPDLRGPDPIYRALERKLTTTGLTIHEVAPEIDAGKILHQESREIPPGVTVLGLYDLMVRDGADLLARWLEGQVVPCVPAPSESAGDYTTFPTHMEVNQFLAQGGELFRLKEWRRALAAVE